MSRFRIVFFTILCGMLLSCATGLSQDRSRASVGLFYNADEYDRLMHGDDLLMSYTGAIEENRATRVVLSPRQTQEQTARILDSIDALLVPGGADIDPKFYNEERHPGLEEPVDTSFDGYELAGIRRAEARGIPILGICRGLQLLNVGAGGTLYQDLPSELGTKVAHRSRDEQGRSARCVHLITISPGSILNEVFRTNRLEVNSYHHQGILRAGEGLEVTARTEDGLAEGIENRRSHLLGVQFHPEKDRKANPLFNAVFTYFIGQALGAKSGAGATAVSATESTFDGWVDAFSAEWVRGDPMAATTAQYFDGAEQDALDRQLTPITKDFRAARVALARRGLGELEQFDRAKLTSSQRISAAMLEWQLEDIVHSERFEDYRLIFQQFGGLQVQLVNFLSQTHPVRNRRDIENYLARLELVGGQIHEGIAQARDRAARGFLPPDFILTSTIAQFDRFLAGKPSENVLVASLVERAAKLGSVPAEERAKYAAAAEKTVTESILPAFRQARALLEEQLPRASADAGLWRFAGGDEAYADALRHSTTTELTARQVHELGLREVARIEQQMEGLLRQLGYKEGSIKERMEKLDADSQPPAEPDPRPGLLADYDRILRDAERRAALIFDLRPKAPVEVRREPPFTEKTAAAHYTTPAKDGSRPGIFWAPLPGPTFRMAQMRTLVYHEAVPGHHFQIALQKEMTLLPHFRRDLVFGFISAYGEGWALYAEQLAAENGWYEGDLKGRLGQLNDELFRARRLVVDTGLHARHWTRQQAVNYGIAPSEVERYVVWPGQACAYKVGMLKILELRAKARQALGDRFSLKEFHNAVLRAGTVPLAVLEQVIDEYVASAGARGG